jgi:hypothetical protein
MWILISNKNNFQNFTHEKQKKAAPGSGKMPYCQLEKIGWQLPEIKKFQKQY